MPHQFFATTALRLQLQLITFTVTTLPRSCAWLRRTCHATFAVTLLPHFTHAHLFTAPSYYPGYCGCLLLFTGSLHSGYRSCCCLLPRAVLPRVPHAATFVTLFYFTPFARSSSLPLLYCFTPLPLHHLPLCDVYVAVWTLPLPCQFLHFGWLIYPRLRSHTPALPLPTTLYFCHCRSPFLFCGWFPSLPSSYSPALPPRWFFICLCRVGCWFASLCVLWFDYLCVYILVDYPTFTLTFVG